MLLERDDVLARADALLAAPGRTPGVLALVGPAGMGTSAVLDEVVSRHGERATVVVGRCGPADRRRSHGVLHRLASQLPPGPVAAAQAVGDLVARLDLAAGARPVLVAVDELHWADPDTLSALARVCGRPAAGPIGLVVSAHPGPEVDGWLAAMGDGCDVAVAELGPLRRRAARRLLESAVGGAVPPATEAAAWRISAGNPGLIALLAGRIRAGDPLAVAPPDPGEVALPELVGDDRVVAEAVAVLGAPARLQLVRGVADLPLDATEAALDRLFRSGVLASVGRGAAQLAEPAHEAALLADLTPIRRAALHRAAYHQARAAGAVDEAARHAIEADLVGDAEALGTIDAAAAAALESGAVHAAVRLAAAALELSGPAVPSSRTSLAADAHLAAGDPAAAAAVLARGLATADLPPRDRVALLRRRSRAAAYLGDLDGARRSSEDALALTRSLGEAVVASVIVEHVHAVWQVGAVRPATELLDRYRAEGPLPDDALLEVVVAFVDLWHGEERKATAGLEALHVVAADPSWSTPFDPALCLATALRFAERYDDDDRLLRAELGAAAAEGRAHVSGPLQISLADGLVRRGRPDAALELLDTADPVRFEPLLHRAVAMTRAFAALEQGASEDLRAHLAEVGAPLTWNERLWHAHLHAGAALLRGDLVAASTAYRRAEAVADELGIGLAAGCTWADHATRAHVGAGRLADAERVCRWLEAGADACDATYPRIAAESGRALLAAADGDTATAERHWEAALTPTGPPLVRARVLLDRAEHRFASGDRAASRPLYREAHDLFVAGGASTPAARCLAGLHRAGGRRSRGEADPGALTPQERRVAELAAQGKLTREIAAELFVSTKTVETHLSHVYAKLGVRSKRELRGRALDEA